MCATVCPSQALFFGTHEEIDRLRLRSRPINEFRFGAQTIHTKVRMMIPREATVSHIDVADAMRAAGIDLRLGTAVTGFTVDGGRVRAVETAASPVKADLVVIGLGVRPNAALARAAGVGVGESGGIRVDDHLRTDTPYIWAAGDCVESHHRMTGRSVVVALGTHANEQGRVVGTNLAGGDAAFGGVLGTAITRFNDMEIARTGLTDREAMVAGLDAIGVITEASSRAHYYPGAAPMKIKMVVERGSGRLLGAQMSPALSCACSASTARSAARTAPSR